MITARLDHAGVDRLLEQIADRGGDLQRPLSVCGEILLTSIDKNFEAQGRYSAAGDVRGGSTRWMPLAASTVLQRLGRSSFRRDGRLSKSGTRRIEGIKILQRSSGGLASSFSKAVSGNTLTVGSNKVYAAIHHYGGQAGRGRRVTIPARPMLVVQDADVEEMIDALKRHLSM